MRVAASIVLLFVSFTALANSSELQKLIVRARSESKSMLQLDTDYDLVSQRAQQAMSRAVLASADADVVVARVAKALSVSKDVAAVLVEAHLRSIDRLKHDKRVDELLNIAVREAPKNRDVVAFYITHAELGASVEDTAAKVLPLTRELPASDAVIFSELSFGGDRNTVIIADALRREPDNPQLQRALLASYDDALKETFGPVRIAGKATFRESWRPLPTKEIAAAASTQIGALVQAGRAEDAIAAYDALPPDIRDAIMAGALKDGGQSVDVRLDLAASALVIGDAKRAAAFSAPVHPPKAETYSPLAAQANELRIINALIATRLDGDIYDILADSINSGARPYGMVWSRVFASLATRGGYESVGQAAVRMAARWSDVHRSNPVMPYLPDVLRAELQATLDRDAATAVQESKAAPSGGAIMKRLAEPRLEIAKEKKLPEAIERSNATVIDCGDSARVAKTMHIPSGWYPLRLERDGSEVVGVAVSQALDPMGEVGRGAYWILHSRDGGNTWDEPLYTGLRENSPYLVMPASALSLMHGDHLEIEVEIHEIDPASITFPPVGLRTKREVKGLYLEIPWEALRRDSDGDGVTDLVEERIVTDPRIADSDGDGIVDGKDALPLVSLAAGKAPEGEVLVSVLNGFRPGRGAILEGLVSTEEQRRACVVRASAIGGGASFFVGDRSFFAPIDLQRRVVVLARDELDAYEKKFGNTYAADVSYMIVRHDGKKALVVLSESWKEDVYELTKQANGEWKMTAIGGWIS